MLLRPVGSEPVNNVSCVKSGILKITGEVIIRSGVVLEYVVGVWIGVLIKENSIDVVLLYVTH